MDGDSIIFSARIFVISLLIASAVAVFARRLRMPYTVGLVLIGLALTVALPPQWQIEIPPQVILALLIPPLVFEAAFHIRLDDLRRDFWLIMLLAVPGVILTTLLVGALVAWGTGLSLSLAMVFGALVSATDPVAVVALFKRLGVPKRLQVLLEGESLLNDGTAIVVFNIALAIALDGNFNLPQSATQFVTVAGGGTLIGIALGALTSLFIRQIDDHLVETTLTTALAFGSYLLAESLHVSGVLAVVAAGIVNGNTGPRGMSPTTRIVVFNFWEYAAFLANSLVFLLIGLTIDVQMMLGNWQAIVWAIVAVSLARAVAIYGFSLFQREIPLRWKHVLYWGGLRGAIALALALSLTTGGALAEERARLQAMTFGVVLFTLLAQGVSMDWLTKRLKLVRRSEAQDEYDRRHARVVAARASQSYLRRMHSQGLLSENTWQMIAPALEQKNAQLAEAMREAASTHPAAQAEELDTARREGLRAQRTALIGLLRDGVIAEDIYAELAGEVDAALTQTPFATVAPAPAGTRGGASSRARLKSRASSDKMNPRSALMRSAVMNTSINHLVLAVIQEQDLDAATRALGGVGVPVTFLSSAGGFLGRRNATLLIGLPEEKEEQALEVLERVCRQRVEYLTLPMEGTPLPLPAPVPVTVGGATVFALPVEKYEEI
ncbi:MAG: K(+)/H(+) antiporter NhaP2 [Anaerolineales bacterium]|nr:K(+)/H(+) antiporter NhaP2 [Anaerolineales bacterium]